MSTTLCWLFAQAAGNVGDGNFHMLLLVDPNSPEDHAKAERLNERLVQRALSMGGTITGEHGIGIGKKKCMNAGKILPPL